MLQSASNYQDLYQTFSWQIPEYYNIGVDVSDKWATRDPDRKALIHIRADGEIETLSFGMLAEQSNKLANTLWALGIKRGDRIAILLPQAPETALAHIATYKMGAIALPLFTLFGPEALLYRLQNSGARAIITNAEGLEKIEELRADLPGLSHVLSIDGPASGALGFHEELSRASGNFEAVKTLADEPALIIYTSGTTGSPKGALHAHRVLLGHLPGVEMPHECFPKPDDLFWTPADWAWVGGLIDVLLPSLHHGIPVIAHRFAKFDPEETFRLMADFSVRNVFMPPTALKLMRQVANPKARWDYKLRSIGSGGETLGGELLDWGRETFGLTVNEFYGQTECNLVLGNCAGIMPVTPGSMGRPIPGHKVAIIDDEGKEVGPGEVGNIAVMRPDPVMFLRYWENEEATAAKFIGDWLMMGDRGQMDEEGYFHFIGRDDDVITSGGYRIGPGEIEDCLLRHPAIAMAAAVGIPDPIRTERIKAFLVLDSGQSPSEELAREIQEFVKARLAAHEYPREIAFVDALPMTATGKIMRRELRAKG